MTIDELVAQQVDAAARVQQPGFRDRVHLRLVRAQEKVDGRAVHDLPGQAARRPEVQRHAGAAVVFVAVRDGGQRVGEARGSGDENRAVGRPTGRGDPCVSNGHDEGGKSGNEHGPACHGTPLMAHAESRRRQGAGLLC